MVTQQSGSKISPISQRVRRFDQFTDSSYSSISVAAIAALTDFSSRRPLRRFACSCARWFAELKTSAKDILVRR
jgi:hypothetical protein